MNMADYEVRIIGDYRSPENPIPMRVKVYQERMGGRWGASLLFTDNSKQRVEQTIEYGEEGKERIINQALDKASELGLETHILHPSYVVGEDDILEIIPCSKRPEVD